MKPTAPAIALFTLSLLALLGVLALPSKVSVRHLKIASPHYAIPNETVTVRITASSETDDGEEIGFLHVEYSTDGGETWIAECYKENLGTQGDCTFEITVGASSTVTMVRARVAFRGGTAGYVDFKGLPLDWSGSWSSWSSPPTKKKLIRVD